MSKVDPSTFTQEWATASYIEIIAGSLREGTEFLHSFLSQGFPTAASRAELGVTPDLESFMPYLRVLDYLRWQVDTKRPRLSHAEKRNLIDLALSRFLLTGVKKRLVGDLSHEEAHLFVLAFASVHEPYWLFINHVHALLPERGEKAFLELCDSYAKGQRSLISLNGRSIAKDATLTYRIEAGALKKESSKYRLSIAFEGHQAFLSDLRQDEKDAIFKTKSEGYRLDLFLSDPFVAQKIMARKAGGVLYFGAEN